MPQASGVRKFTKSQRRVLWFLMNRLRVKGDWQTHASVHQHVIAAKLGIARCTVIRALAVLQAEDVVARLHQPIGTGGRNADLIVLNRSAVERLIGVSESSICDIRKSAKCDIRSISLVVKRSGKTACASLRESPGQIATTDEPTEPTEPTKQGGVMQGEFFVGNRSGQSKPKPDLDNAKARLRTFQDAYRAKYGRPQLVVIGAAMGAIGRWQTSCLPTPAHWAEAVRAYLGQNDEAVLEAAHPLLWLQRRLPALLPAIERQVEADIRSARMNAEIAAQAARMTDHQKRQLQYPGILEGESMPDYSARINAERAAYRKGRFKRWA